MNYQFRILENEDTGASVDLEGDMIYRVGNNMDFEIFIPALEVSESPAFQFIVYNNRVTFSNVTNEIIRIDPQYFTKSPAQPDAYDTIPALFEYMNIKFAICDANDSWEKWQSISQTPPPEPLKTPTAMTEEEASHINNLYPQGTGQPSFFDKYIEPLQLPAFLKNKQVLASFVIVPVLALGLIFGYKAFVKYYAIQDGAHNKIANTLTSLQEIKQIEVNLPTQFSNLKFITNQSDLVVIMGVVKDQADINYLKEKFSKFSALIDFKILTANQALSQLTNILKSRNLVLVTPFFDEKTYRIRIVGFVDSLDVINDIELDINLHLPQISDMDTAQVYAIPSIDHEFDEMLEKNKFTTRLKLTKSYETKTVYIDGYLSANEINTLKTNCDSIESHYPDLLKIVVNVKDALASLPYRIVAVSTGGLPSFMTETGQKIFEGTEVDGIRVDKITPTQIVFSGRFSLILKLDDALGYADKDKKK